ncbi:MAG: trypsin-like peptidase domain-containing protein [Chthoniobacterales bacterium]
MGSGFAQVIVLSVGICFVRAEPADVGNLADSISDRVQNLFRLHKDAVVRVEGADRHGRLEGTGFYADPSGTIYTLAVAIGDGENITVHQGVRKFPARLLITDPRTGIAIIKVDANTPFLPIGDSAEVELATPVVSIGYPMGLPETPNFGVVAGFDREYLNRYFRTTHIRANLPVQRGVGGAPVMNLDGEVVGIVVAGVDGNAGCFMLPINAAEKARMEFERFGELRPGWAGVSVEHASDPSLPSSARVANLHPGTPATECGLRNGDILLQVGDVPVRTPEDLIDASFFLTSGDESTIKLLRDGRELVLEFHATAHPTLTDPLRNETMDPFVNDIPRFDLESSRMDDSGASAPTIKSGAPAN